MILRMTSSKCDENYGKLALQSKRKLPMRCFPIPLAKGPALKVVMAAIVGEDGLRSDIKVMPWPSDHRAVVAEVQF